MPFQRVASAWSPCKDVPQKKQVSTGFRGWASQPPLEAFWGLQNLRDVEGFGGCRYGFVQEGVEAALGPGSAGFSLGRPRLELMFQR